MDPLVPTDFLVSADYPSIPSIISAGEAVGMALWVLGLFRVPVIIALGISIAYQSLRFVWAIVFVRRAGSATSKE